MAPRRWQPPAAALARSSSLLRVDLRGNKIESGSDGAKALDEVLSKRPHLTVLYESATGSGMCTIA